MRNSNENFRILIVDDSDKTIEVFSNILRKEHYDVSFALSGKEALELMKSREFDFIRCKNARNGWF
jgi:CheY-like chemotaxis protein